MDNDASARPPINADITYGTNNELGFDYLRDNMVIYKENQVQRGHNFAIVDEVDSILIDEARTPLIISGQGDKSTDLYSHRGPLRQGPAHGEGRRARRQRGQRRDLFRRRLYRGREGQDRHAHPVRRAQGWKHSSTSKTSPTPKTSPSSTTSTRPSRRAASCTRDIDYVVKDGEVIIVDEFTGRLMYGRRYNEGLHQAIEAKEGVKVARESKTLATITFQNFFRLYEKLSGMTGTAMTEEEEFREIYKLDVVEIPTNKPMIRKDHAGRRLQDRERGKFNAVIDDIVGLPRKGPAGAGGHHLH